MIWDGKIFKISGASDYEDSSMFNGLIVLFRYDDRVSLLHFIDPSTEKIYVRHPYGSKYDFSRDQYICLAAGLSMRPSASLLVSERFISGKDLLSPAVHGHTKRCQWKKSNWFEDLWLKAEILIHAYFTPTDEPNQLIAMAMVAGEEYLRLWTSHNKKWEYSIQRYWCKDDGAWRNEPEFASHMIATIKQKLNIKDGSL